MKCEAVTILNDGMLGFFVLIYRCSAPFIVYPLTLPLSIKNLWHCFS